MNPKAPLVILLLLIPLLALGENWPRFRGEGGQGHSLEKGVPSHWSHSENIKWKVGVPGNGWSSPVIWGDRVVLTSTTDDDQSCRVICLDVETGEHTYAEAGVGKGCLTYADGMLYTLGEKGTMGLVPATPGEHKVVSQFDLPAGGEGLAWAHPVVCGGRLYLRHGELLYAYDIRGER